MDDKKKERIIELTKLLNKASKAYYAEDKELIDNLTYDRLYDELLALEEETGFSLSDSPTKNVGYESVPELPKIRHTSPMLSLDKTKDVETLKGFIGNNKTLLSWKMDGLTIVLTYNNGSLTQAVTRGDGHIGELVTNNARVFKQLPLFIPYKGNLVIRGEAYITYNDFEMINNTIEDVESKYKNPRNLCSGSVRVLNNEITARRNVRIKIFSLVSASDVDFSNSHENEFKWLSSLGFDVVGYKVVTADSLDSAITYFKEQIKKNSFPSDGLVALYDDISYGESLGMTAKFPKNAFAFKWADEQKSTHLREIEWSPSRTGLINPIAVFDPVELEGTTVSRASVHNVSILKELKLGIGDEILVYKANMIIPQISKNLTGSANAVIPDKCPACSGHTKIVADNETQTLICTNKNCPAKAIKSFALFAGRDALNIEGMSEATLEKFIAHGFIHDYSDLFKLSKHKDEIVKMDGFGEKSYIKIINAAKKASNTTLQRLICGLGIPNIGSAAARLIAEKLEDDPTKVCSVKKEDLLQIDGIGDIIADDYVNFFNNENNINVYKELLKVLKIEKMERSNDNPAKGKTFVITGSLYHYENRNELKAYIESIGGKVAGSVSKKTDYLINNDVNSTSSKNRTAKDLGVNIINEDDFIKMFS